MQIPYGESQGGIDQELGMANKRTSDRQQGSHFSKSELNGANNQTYCQITEKSAEWPCGLDGTSKTKKQTRALSTVSASLEEGYKKLAMAPAIAINEIWR